MTKADMEKLRAKHRAQALPAAQAQCGIAPRQAAHPLNIPPGTACVDVAATEWRSSLWWNWIVSI
jgi:hypothetical protein